MSDVSCRLFEFFQDQAELHGIGLEHLLEGTELDLEQLQDPTQWVPWDRYAALCNRLQDLIGPEAMIRAGMRIPQHDYSAPMRALSASLARPAHLYDAVFTWMGPRMFRNLEFEVQERSANRLIVTIAVPSPGAPSPGWMHIAEGSFRTLPGMLGLDDALVHATMVDDGQAGRFDVLLPASETLLDRAWRRTQLAIRPGALLQTLAGMQQEIHGAYREIAASEHVLRQIVETLPDPVALCEGDDIVVSNRTWRQTLGTVTTLSDLFGPQGPPEEVVAGGRIFERARDLQPQNATTRLVLLRDVTEARREAQRRLLTDRLTSLGTMAASVGHELNNPLTYVLGSIDLLQQDLDTLEGEALRNAVAQSVEMANEGLVRMRQITSDLQLFVRGASNESDALVDLRDVLGSSLRMANSKLRGVATVHLDLTDQLVVQGQAARLGQVFLNLLLNAARAMREAPPREHVLTVQGRMDGDWTEVAVEDTGPGIPSNPERLFEPFYTTRADGTGLGLAICRRLVQEHHGTLHAESAPEGARFVVRIPATRGATPAPAPSRHSRPRHVVFVDDEPGLAALVARLLDDHDLHAFSDPHAALTYIQEHAEHIDLVLCDVHMGGLSGPDLADRLPDAVQGRLVWVTAGIAAPDLIERLAGRTLLHKPFRREALLELIHRCSDEASAKASG